MADLTPLQTLQRIIASELPAARAKLDSPHTETGSWFLDVEWNGAIAIVEWRPSQGFGVADERMAFGEGPEFVTADAEAAAFAAIAKLREMEGTRDTLIVSQESEFRDELRQGLLSLGVFSDTVSGPEEAAKQLGQKVYRSIVVDLFAEWARAFSEGADAARALSNSLTIAIPARTTDRMETPDWAEILVRRDTPPRELAFMIHGLLQYRDDVRRWPKIIDSTGDAPN